MKTANKVMAILAMVVLALSALSTAQAAAITWGAAQNINSADPTQVSTTGTYVYAYAFGLEAAPPPLTVNTVDFWYANANTAYGPGAVVTNLIYGFIGGQGVDYWCGAYFPPHAITGYDGILHGAVWAGNNYTLGLNNLTIGKRYAVQVWSRQTDYPTQTAILDGAVTLSAAGQYAIGTFTAGATSQTLNVSGVAKQINAIQLREVPQIISQANGDWANGPTWDLNPTTPINPPTTWDVVVRHNVSYAATGQTVLGLTLDNANSNLTIPVGKDLTAGGAEVKNGALTVNGALNSNLTVSGGTATIAAGSTGTVPTLKVMTGGSASVAGSTVTTANVSGGIATLTGGTIGTVNASGGTTNLGTGVAALNISNAGTVVQTTAPVTVPTVTVSGGTLTLGLAGSSMTANNVAITGSTVNTQNSYLLVGNQITLPSSLPIVSINNTSGPAFGLKGSDLGALNISALQLNGDTVAFSLKTQKTISLVDNFNGWTGGASFTSQSLTVNPSANVLVVQVDTRSGDTGCTGVTYGGTALTLAKTQLSAITTRHISHIYYMFDPPTGAANTLAATFSGVSENRVSAFTLGGVDTTKAPQLTAGWTGGGNAAGPSTTVTLSNILAGSTAVLNANVRTGAGPETYTITSGSGTLVRVWSGLVGNIYGDSSLFQNVGAGGLTFTASAASSPNVAVAAAVFAPGAIVPTIDLGSTSVEVTASSVLELGGATSASFFDLFPMCPDGTVLRIQGAGVGVAQSLASFFDVDAPSADYWTQTANGTYAGGWWYELTYSGGAIPEPAGLGLLGLALLAVRKHRS